MALEDCKHAHTFDETRKELVEHGSPMFPIACYLDSWKKEYTPWHWHKEMEIVLVKEGDVTVAIGSEKMVLHAGDGYFANMGILHGAWNAGGGPCYFHVLVFHPRLVGGSLDSIYWQKYLQPLIQEGALPCYFFRGEREWDRQIMAYAEQAWQAYVAGEPGYEWEVRAALSRFIFSLQDKCRIRKNRYSNKNMRDSLRIKAMLQYIQDHYVEEISSEQIAASAAVSESEALRCFRGTIGTTPIQYVKRFRVQKAVELLETTDLKVQEVGERCGFQDMSYFARTFRKVQGCTPTEYRNKNEKLGNQ